jgi:thioesterase domain-containing protein
LRDGSSHREAAAIVQFRGEGNKPPLFLVHGVDGSVERFRVLSSYFEAGQPVYGVLSQALVGEAAALMRVEDMARYYLKLIKKLYPHPPYHFLGFSFGGLVAFEMALQLQARQEQVGMLGMLDNLRMGSGVDSEDTQQRRNEARRRWKLAAHHLRQTISPKGLAYLKGKLEARALRTIYTFLDARGKAVPRVFQRAEDINWFAGVNYKPGSPLRGGVTLFQASESAFDARANNHVWTGSALGGVEAIRIPGKHGDVLDEPNVGELAEAIKRVLARMAGNHPTIARRLELPTES